MGSHECIELLDSSDEEEEENQPVVARRASSGSGANEIICIDSSDDERDFTTNESIPSSGKQDNVPKKPQQEVIEIDSSDDEVKRSRKPISNFARTTAAVAELEESDSDGDCDSSDDEQYRLMHRNRPSARMLKSQTVTKSDPSDERVVEDEKKPAALSIRPRTEGPSATGRQQKRPNAPTVRRDNSASIVSGGQPRDNNVSRRNQTQNVARSCSPSRKQAFPGRARTPSPKRRYSNEALGKEKANLVPPSRPQNQSLYYSTSNKSASRPIANNTSLKRPYPATVPLTKKSEDEDNSSSDDSLMNSGPVFGNRPVAVQHSETVTHSTKHASVSRPAGNNTTKQRPKPSPTSSGTANHSIKRSEGDSSSGRGDSLMNSGSVFGKRPENAPIPRKKLPNTLNFSPPHRQPSTITVAKKSDAIPRNRPAGSAKPVKPSLLRSDSLSRPQQSQQQQQRSVPTAKQERPMPPVKKQRNNELTPSRRNSSLLSPKKNSPGAFRGSPAGTNNKKSKKMKQLAFGAAARSLAKSMKKAPPPPDDDSLVALGRSKKAGKRSSFLANDRFRQAAQPGPSPSRDMLELVAKRKSPPPLSSRPKTSILRNKDDGQAAGPPRKETEPPVSEASRVPPAVAVEKDTGLAISREKPPQISDTGNGTMAPPFPRKEMRDDKNIASNSGPVMPQDGCLKRMDVTSDSKKQDSSALQASHDIVADSTVTASLSSQPLVRKSTANGISATPFARKDMAGEKTSSSSSNWSIVSPADDSDERINITSGSQPGSSASKTVNKNVSDKELSSELTERFPTSSSTADLMDSPTVDSQASSEFASYSDSDSELDQEKVETENTSLLHDSLASDESLNVWTRRTRKIINYSEPADDIELTDSQMYVDNDSPPAKRRKEDETRSDQTSRPESRDAASTVRSSSRKRKSRSDDGAVSPCSDVSTPDLEEEGDGNRELKGSLWSIEHLSKYTYDSNGLPTHDFSVLGGDDTIYDLSIQVRQSEIPGSGMGAFLTFRGARVLKEHLREEADKKLAARVFHEPITMKPLEAISPDGFGITVKLTGNNLHGNQNNPYWRPEDLQAEKDGTGNRLQSDDSSPDEERVGHLGLHTEDDYVSDPTIALRCVDFSIELGRYGPVLKSDRKREPDYDLKNYLFSDAPAEYGFAVEEPLAKCKQVIDLTDDATGTRHEAALRLPMSYINEIGHSKTMKANVHIRDKEDRSVYYYLQLTKPLQMGESVELLTNYDETYEPVRERKGYGKANIENRVKSNDHEPTALMRNFEERGFITNLINSRDVVGLFHLTEFAAENILTPLDSLIEDFFRGGVPKITCLQWVARYRCGWVGELILQRCSSLLAELPPVLFPGFPHRNLLKQVKKWGKQMRWNHFDRQCMDSLAARDAPAFAALKAASKEDRLYRLSKKIVKPLDESMWCPAARKLITDLCEDTTTSLLMKTGERDKFLLQSYLGRAREAEVVIRGACHDGMESEDSLSLLKFVSDVAKDEVVTESVLKNFSGFKEKDFFQKHTTVRKGVVATLLELQCYRDSLAVGLLPDSADVKIAPKGTLHEAIIVGGNDPSNATNVIGYPRHVDSVRKDRQIHEEWYLLWQVAYVVHCFANEFIGKSASDVSQYSLARLCAHIDVDLSKAQAVVDQGIDTTEYPVFVADKPRTQKRQARKQSGSKSAPRKATATQSRGPSLNRALFDGVIWKTLTDLGWTLDVGTRPTDFYFLPTGVKRGRSFGFSNRKDYFDSTKLVMEFIKTDSRWKDRPEVVEAIGLFYKLDKLRIEKKLPKTFDVEKLKEHFKTS